MFTTEVVFEVATSSSLAPGVRRVMRNWSLRLITFFWCLPYTLGHRDIMHCWTTRAEVYLLQRPLVHLQIQLLASLVEDIEHVCSRVDLDADPLDVR